MKNLSRNLFHNVIGKSNTRKALVLYLFIKNRYKTSVVPNFTYKEISKETGLCYSSLRKRLELLKQMDLIEYIGNHNQHLLFKKARSKQSNINLEQIDLNNIKSMECGLCAMFITEKQVQKEYVKQLLAKKYSSKTYKEYKKIKKEIRKCGIIDNFFHDNGISYKYIADKLHTGFNKVVDAIKYAENMGTMFKQTHFVSIYSKKNDGFNAYKYIDAKNNTFATKDNIFIVYANTYHLAYPISYYGI